MTKYTNANSQKQVKLSKNAKNILHIVGSSSFNTNLNQKEISSKLNINISTVNRNMVKMKKLGFIVEKRLQKNSKKYFVDSKFCKANGIEMNNSSSDIHLYNRCKKERLKDLEQEKVQDNRYLYQIRNFLIQKPKKVIGGELLWQINNDWLNEKQVVERYVKGRKDDKGKMFYKTNNPHSLKMYRNHLTGCMIFNIDFSTVEEITPMMTRNVNRFREIVLDTRLMYIKNSQILEFLKMYDNKFLFSKLLHVVNYFRRKGSGFIRNIFAYLKKCFDNALNNKEKVLLSFKGIVNGVVKKFQIPNLDKIRHRIFRLENERITEVYNEAFDSVININRRSYLYEDRKLLWDSICEIFGIQYNKHCFEGLLWNRVA